MLHPVDTSLHFTYLENVDTFSVFNVLFCTSSWLAFVWAANCKICLVLSAQLLGESPVPKAYAVLILIFKADPSLSEVVSLRLWRCTHRVMESHALSLLSSPGRCFLAWCQKEMGNPLLAFASPSVDPPPQSPGFVSSSKCSGLPSYACRWQKGRGAVT